MQPGKEGGSGQRRGSEGEARRDHERGLRRTPECALRVFQNVELQNAATDSAVLAGFLAVRGHARGKHSSSRRRRRSNSSS
jgi:hypothetical protein